MGGNTQVETIQGGQVIFRREVPQVNYGGTRIFLALTCSHAP